MLADSTTDDQIGAAQQLGIDREQISKMLVALGVDLTHPLAPSFMLGAFDVMAAADLAAKMPEVGSFDSVLLNFETLDQVQPEPVALVQLSVLEAVCTHCATISSDRIQAIIDRIERAVQPA